MNVALNQDYMEGWLRKAKSGDKVIYYDGMLIVERERFFVNGGTADRMPEPMRVAKIAWKAYLDGIVHLVQKKRGFMSYEYIAVKA